MMKNEPCTHLVKWLAGDIKYQKEQECEACIKIGSEWVHLRTCQTCGATLCCDASPHQHATKHAQNTNHPIAISAEPDEQWAWCYIDEQIIKY